MGEHWQCSMQFTHFFFISACSMHFTLLVFLLSQVHNLTVDQLNTMYTNVLPVIRATNPTRVIYLGGLRCVAAVFTNC